MIKVIIIFLILTNHVIAGQLYTCIDPDKTTTIQSKPCNKEQLSKTLNYNYKKNNREPWYKNKSFIKNNNSQNIINKNTSPENNECKYYKKKLEDAEKIRWDIKKRRHYSKQQKKYYDNKIDEEKKNVKTYCKKKYINSI